MGSPTLRSGDRLSYPPRPPFTPGSAFRGRMP